MSVLSLVAQSRMFTVVFTVLMLGAFFGGVMSMYNPLAGLLAAPFVIAMLVVIVSNGAARINRVVKSIGAQ